MKAVCKGVCVQESAVSSFVQRLLRRLKSMSGLDLTRGPPNVIAFCRMGSCKHGVYPGYPEHIKLHRKMMILSHRFFFATLGVDKPILSCLSDRCLVISPLFGSFVVSSRLQEKNDGELQNPRSPNQYTHIYI